MAETRHDFIQFGEFLPDRKLFGNEGLLRAYGVTPISGNYIQAPDIRLPGGPGNSLSNLGTDANGRTDDAFGFFAHQVFNLGARNQYAYYGAKDKLVEIDVTAGDPLSETDRSKVGGYSFGTSPPTIHDMWWFTSFGASVVATNFNNPVQYLTTPGSGKFADMVSSSFKPQGRFAFPIRQNMFLAYCFLPASFDGLDAGTHPQLVVWSQNGVLEQFGAESVDSSKTGAGYQQDVGTDLGPIQAAVGGDFGLVFCSKGIVRIDGPPYEFRVIVEGDTTLFPYSVFRLDQDIYFWGIGGPSVLRGGEPPVERLAVDRAQRSLLDNVTGFGADFSVDANMEARQVSGGADSANGLVRFSYVPHSGAYAGSDAETPAGVPPTLLFDYSIRSGRMTISRSAGLIETEGEPAGAARDFFLRQFPIEEGVPWGPHGQVIGLKQNYEDNGESWYPFQYKLQGGQGDIPPMELRTAFGRLHDRRNTRIIAVRPVWSNTEGLASSIEGGATVRIHTKNKSWEDETNSDEHSTFSDDGWIGTDSSFVGAYHSVTLKFNPNLSPDTDQIHEVEGVEILYIEGGEFGA